MAVRAHVAAHANQPHGGVVGDARQGSNQAAGTVTDNAEPGEVQQPRDVAIVAELNVGRGVGREDEY